jgi:glycosyltransferase involved in cell wall biosynthesis
MSRSRSAKILQLAAVDITVQYFLLPLIERLRTAGCEVQIACSSGPYLPILRAKGYRVHSIKIARRIFSFAHVRALWQLYRLMKRECFDVVHAHTPVAGALGRLAARSAAIPLVFYTSHGFYLPGGKPLWRRRSYLAIERYLGRRCTDYLFTVSDEDRELAIHEGIISPDRTLWTHGVGVDTAHYHCSLSEPARQSLRRSLGLERDDRVIGFIGRLVREKGIEELLLALARVREHFPDAKLLLIGETLTSDRDQRMHRRIEALIRENRLESAVRLAGFREDIPQLLAVMDFFVLPSHREGMPRSILEAMAAGLPVVATNIRGCREEVVNGATGLLVPVGDVAQLSQAIMNLLSDSELARRMGDAGRKRVQDLFEERAVLERQVEIYRTLLAKRGLWPGDSS